MAKLGRSFTLRQLAILCGLLLILGSLITPNSLVQRIPGLDILGFGDGLGAGQANAQGDIGPTTIGTVTCPPVSYTDNGTHYLLNNSVFIYAFDKDGYSDLICDLNGEPLIDATFCQLEILATRRDIEGTPSVEEIDAYHYRVTRTFVANILTYSATLKIIWDIYACDDGKLTIDFQNGNRAIGQDVKIRWYNSVLMDDYEQTDTRVTFRGHTDIGLDWSDVEGYNVSNELSDLVKGTASEIIITIGTIGANEHVVIDPSTVGTSSTSYSTSYPVQRKTFYGYSRYWVFFANSNYIYYTSSLDGTTWETPTSVKSRSSTGIVFSLWFDGTYVHCAHGTPDTIDPIWYRRGTPSEDGTITWSSAQEAVEEISGSYLKTPTICTDSTGHPIIGYIVDNGTDTTPYITKSDQNDGTWSSSTYNTQLSTDNYATWMCLVLPYGSKDLAVYAADGQAVKSKVYDAGWGTENSTTCVIEAGEYLSGVVTSDNVPHLVFLEDITYDVQYTTYNGTDWETEEEIYSGNVSALAPVLSKTLDDNLYCFWAEDPTDNVVYYTTQTSGVWADNYTVWQTGESDLLGDRISCAYEQTTCNYIPVGWATGAGSPYSVRFGAVERDLENWLAGYESRQALSVAAAVPTSSNVTRTYSTAGTYYWNCPSGVTTVDVVCRGGGGGGGGNAGVNNAGAGGGGGGGYATQTCNVTPGVTYTIVVGAAGGGGVVGTGYIGVAGGQSYFDNTSVVCATGGGGGQPPAGGYGGGTGGTATAGSGYSGGNGGNGGANVSGGGGEGACSTGNGAAGTSALPGIGGSGCDGGDGGNGGTNTGTGTNGSPGTAPGGGGGGGYRVNATHTGGDGAAGKVILNFTAPTLDDKVNIDVFRGSPTVEDGTWTVEGETYNYRVPFTIQTFTAITANTYPIRIVVDTETLVDGGFTSDNWEWGKRLEWADSSGNNTMDYWASEWTSAGATIIKHWNTNYPGTVFFVTPAQNLSANTTYTFYMYVDPDIDNDSGNYGGSGMVGTSGFFEHFDTATDNLEEFLDTYTDWEVQKEVGFNDPTANTTGSVLTVQGDALNHWQGVYTANYSIEDYRFYVGMQERPGNYSAVGTVSTNLTANYNHFLMYNMVGASTEFRLRYSGATTRDFDIDYWTATDERYIFFFEKYEDAIRSGLLMDDPAEQPDTYGYTVTDTLRKDVMPIDDEAHYAVVSCFTTYDIKIDWIFLTLQVASPPAVSFPDITYEQTGVVFCNDEFYDLVDWTEEIAFTNSSGSTELYWCIDDLAQLTKQPGYSVRATVKLDSPVTANTSVFCYYRNASPASTHQSCEDTYNTATEAYRWQDFSDNNSDDWTVDSGSWNVTAEPEPVLDRSLVGNVGGEARCWVREAMVFKVGDDYYGIANAASWEKAAVYWPMPYTPMVCRVPDIEGPWQPMYFINLPSDTHIVYANGWAAGTVWVEGTTVYLMLYGGRIAYTTDIEDEDGWTLNENFSGITADWVKDEDPGTFGAAIDGQATLVLNFLKHSPYWYIMITGIQQCDGHAAYAYTSENNSPEDWNDSTFTYGCKLLDEDDAGTPKWIEDDHIIFSASDNKWYWAMQRLVGSSYTVRYFTLDASAVTFPGVYGNWTAAAAFTFNEQPEMVANSATFTSPRFLIDDSGDFLLYYATWGIAGTASYTTRWIPNYIFCAKSTTTPGGTFYHQNLDYKYRQATAAGVLYSHVTDSGREADGCITAQIMLGSDGENKAGIMYRLDNATGNGYFACGDYASGSPKIYLFPMTAGALGAAIGTYTVDLYPVPRLSPTYTFQLRVEYYQDEHRVYLSLWGNQWIECFDETDSTYLNAGHWGVGTSGAEALFNDIAFMDYVNAPPYVSSAGDPTLSMTVTPTSLTSFYEQGAGSATSYLRADTWYTSENLSGDPSSGTPLFTLTNDGSYTVDVSISSSANWTGIGKTWTVSPTGVPGDSTIGIWAGLDSDTSYPTLVKPDAPANLLIIGLGSGEHDHFGLLFYTPTTNLGNVTMSGTVTLTAMVHT